MRAADAARLVALAAIWGASFLFIGILAPAIGPVATADLRMLIAGGALAAYFSLTGFDPEWRRGWRYYLLIGVLNSAAPFVPFGYAAFDLSVGLLVVFNATSPMWARFSRRSCFGSGCPWRAAPACCSASAHGSPSRPRAAWPPAHC